MLRCIAGHLSPGADCLGEGQQRRWIQLDFNAAFDRVSHEGLLYKLQSIGVSGAFLSIIMDFLSGRSQTVVVVDGSQSALIDVASGVPQGNILDPVLLLVYTSKVFSLVINTLVGYADDKTLLEVVPDHQIVPPSRIPLILMGSDLRLVHALGHDAQCKKTQGRGSLSQDA